MLQAGSAGVLAGRGPEEVMFPKGNPRFLLSTSHNGQVYQDPSPEGQRVKGQGGVGSVVRWGGLRSVSSDEYSCGLRPTQ